MTQDNIWEQQKKKERRNKTRDGAGLYTGEQGAENKGGGPQKQESWSLLERIGDWRQLPAKVELPHQSAPYPREKLPQNLPIPQGLPQSYHQVENQMTALF